jgi:nitroimidazol reductase NimA-like FMN-containing flavoprotein (pyridoxamine 5'-phosphate oxidase superfamily)
MSLDLETEMSAGEVDALLGRHEPYAIPISYGFDPDERCFYLRLVSTPESEKRRFLASTPATRLVVYEEDGDTYRSVVATGDLEEVPRSALTVDHVVQYGDAKRPLFEIWGEVERDLDVGLYVLDPEELSGRQIEVDRTEG